MIILSRTFMSCILQYSSTHNIQCIQLHWLTFEAGDLINMPISGYYKLSSNYHQWDIYIRHSSYILKHGGGSLCIHNKIDCVLMYELLTTNA